MAEWDVYLQAAPEGLGSPRMNRASTESGGALRGKATRKGP